MTKPISLQQWIRQAHRWRIKKTATGMPLLPKPYVWRLWSGPVQVDVLDFDGSIDYSYERSDYFLCIATEDMIEQYLAGTCERVSKKDPPTTRKVQRTAKKIVRKMMKYSDLGDLE